VWKPLLEAPDDALMVKRPEDDPYPSEEARQRAITARLVIVIGLLAGAVFALLLRRYMGGE
jgi:hypothetical protein